MTHNSEDELLAYALQAMTSDGERAGIAAHLAVCSECSARLTALQKDIEIIGGVRPRTPILRTAATRPRETVAYAVLRTAALVVVGILVGFGVAKSVHHEPEFLSSAYVALSPPADSATTHTASDATGVPARYYEELLEQGK